MQKKLLTLYTAIEFVIDINLFTHINNNACWVIKVHFQRPCELAVFRFYIVLTELFFRESFLRDSHLTVNWQDSYCSVDVIAETVSHLNRQRPGRLSCHDQDSSYIHLLLSNLYNHNTPTVCVRFSILCNFVIPLQALHVTSNWQRSPVSSAKVMYKQYIVNTAGYMLSDQMFNHQNKDSPP